MSIFKHLSGDNPTVEDVVAVESLETEVMGETVDQPEETGEVALEELNPEVEQVADDIAQESLTEDAVSTAEIEISDDFVAVEQSIVDTQAALEAFNDASVIANAVTPLRIFNRRTLGGFEDIVQASRDVSLSVNALNKSLGQYKLIANLSEVASNYSLSSPVVATMRAIPGFTEASQSFPSADIFNVIPERNNSAKLTLGLESLSLAQGELVNGVGSKLSSVVSAFGSVLETLSDRVSVVKTRIADAKADLSASTIDDDTVAVLPVTTLSDEAFTSALDMVQDYLKDLVEFNADDLRAYPEKLKEEIDGLVDITGDLGRILGVAADDTGVTEVSKGDDYVPTQGTFGEKNISKASVLLYLDKVDTIADLLQGISDKRDDLISALSREVSNTPETVASDDVTYGSDVHARLISSYVVLNTKLVEEAVVLVSRISSVVDTIADSEPTIVD
jgi:hypothetical protein